MEKAMAVTVRVWTCILLLGVLALIVVSPWWVADWTDEIGVLVYCLLVAPMLVGGLVGGSRSFLTWIRS